MGSSTDFESEPATQVAEYEPIGAEADRQRQRNAERAEMES